MVQYKYILEAIEKSYSHKPHLADLPYDLNTNDPEKLKERLKACKRGLREAKQDLKDMQENLEFNESLIKESENNIKSLEDENNKLEEENARVTETIGKVHDHFEDVTMMTEEDGWEIKKTYDELKKYSLSSEITDEMDSLMNEFIDEVSLLGYIPNTYPKDDSIRPQKYIDDKFNPLIEKFLTVSGQHASLDDPAKDSSEFVATCDKLIDQMEDYRDKYDISKDTPLRRQLEKIENDGGLTDTYEDTVAKNNKKIERNNEYIEGNKKEIERLTPRHSEIKREVGKLETKVNDFKTHKDKIQEKIDKVSG